jgi:hypothetical protein
MMFRCKEYTVVSDRELRFLLGGTDADIGGGDGGIVILPTDDEQDGGDGGIVNLPGGGS